MADHKLNEKKAVLNALLDIAGIAMPEQMDKRKCPKCDRVLRKDGSCVNARCNCPRMPVKAVRERERLLQYYSDSPVSVCEYCGCRYAGEFGHGPSCNCTPVKGG